MPEQVIGVVDIEQHGLGHAVVQKMAQGERVLGPGLGGRRFYRGLRQRFAFQAGLWQPFEPLATTVSARHDDTPA